MCKRKGDGEAEVGVKGKVLFIGRQDVETMVKGLAVERKDRD